MNKAIFYLLAAALGIGCGRTPAPDARELRVKPGGALLYSTPGKTDAPLLRLAPREPVTDLGRVSSFVTPLQFGDTLLEAPWLEVRTARGERGWVFAAAVEPVQGAPTEWFLQKRLDCFLGPALREQCLRWRDSLPNRSTDTALASAYHQALALRAEILQRLNTRAEPNEAGFEPDLFWLKDALPYFVVQRVAASSSDSSGRLPWLFFDYASWAALAQQTSGAADDRFFALCLLAYPTDGIESFYPIWTIQTGERTGSSQLGSGRHVQLFQAIDATLADPTAFHADIVELKNQLINDIVNGGITYWQPGEKILTELNEIIKKEFDCLDARDRLALVERRALFDAAVQPARTPSDSLTRAQVNADVLEANGIRVNLRAGQ